MKHLIFAIEALRENCRWNDDNTCRFNNEQPLLGCKSVRVNEHVATTDLLTEFIESCPLMRE
jgi:hypothetical protein